MAIEPIFRLRGRRGVAQRRRFLADFPLCAHCEAKQRIREAEQVDHIIPLEYGGDDDESNKQALCKACHSAKTARDRNYRIRPEIGADGYPIGDVRPDLSKEANQRRIPMDLKPSRIPLSIVCGPPGSGKSTYIRERATANDIIVDLDRIVQKLAGLPEHVTPVAWLVPAMEERNRQLHSLATDSTHDHAWFIVSAPDPLDRKIWHRLLGGEMVVLSTPLAECIRRIKADPARRGYTDRMIDAAHQWWQSNSARI